MTVDPLQASRKIIPVPNAGPDGRGLEVEPVTPLTDAELPRVTMVVLNWNGRQHLDKCFASALGLDYPEDKRELILVDNGSDDGSLAHVRANHPWVRIVENERNTGFSAGCNQGSRNAVDADVFVFLNNDLRVEPDFLRHLVAPIVRGACEATTARMRTWDGQALDSAGGGMNFHGIGIQRGHDQPDDERFAKPRLTLFACGGAMAMRADVFRETGGFDEDFFAYYEDVDLGWRTWLMGYSVRYEPKAICYHDLSSTSRRVPPERLRRLQVRNPLLVCFKNYDDANLQRVLPTMTGLALRRALLHLGPIDREPYRIEDMRTLPGAGWWGRFKQGWAKRRRTQVVNRVGVADLLSLDELYGGWDHWMARRQSIQALRKRPDSEILPLFLHPHWRIEQDPAYASLQNGLSAFMQVDDMFAGLTNLGEEPI